MKKLIIAGVLVFAFALTANVAFACFCPPPPGDDECECPAITVTNSNSGAIENITSATALTGNNFAAGGWSAGITSGAATAVYDVQNQIGWNATSVTGATGPVTIGNYNSSSVTNLTTAFAGTGMNVATSKCGIAGITSGDALSGSNVVNIVGYNITTISD